MISINQISKLCNKTVKIYSNKSERRSKVHAHTQDIRHAKHVILATNYVVANLNI